MKQTLYEKTTYKKAVLKLNCLNLNDRIYTTECANLMLEQFYQKKSNGNTMFGQIGFPDGSMTEINKVSHIVHDLKIIGDIMYANIEILDNQNGKIISTLLNRKWVFRTRAVGSINENKTVNVQELISIDVIPICDDSFNGMM